MTLDVEVSKLNRRLSRETNARLAAEAIAERGLRDLYQRQREIELLEAIAVGANSAQGTDDAMQMALERICHFTDWPLAHVFYVPRAGKNTDQPLVSTGLWHGTAGGKFDAFKAATDGTKFLSGTGLPGLVWQTAVPQWIPEISASPNFPRIAHAEDVGIRAAFAFPVLVEQEVVAILEFFSPIVQLPDFAILRLMAQIGTQLGRVVERNRNKERLTHDAHHDALTQLGNRSLFLSQMQLLLNRAQRVKDYLFAVLFVDLDRFKTVNDGLGHAVGDQLIVAVADRLVNCLRDTDIVARGNLDNNNASETVVARLGGDEFTILLDDLRDESAAIHVAERIQDALVKPFNLGQHTVYASASIGIAISTTGYEHVVDMVRDADIAMYRAKQSGRARYVLFDSAMHAQVVRKLELERDLRMALERGEFFLCYQPIVSLADSTIRGFESLIRWRHPVRGLVSPAEFIPRAEEIGLIVPIGNWVLAEACKQLNAWHAAFPADPPLFMSVNVSAKQIEAPGLVDQVATTIAAKEIAAATLKIELTESSIMTDTAAGLDLMLELKKLGVQLSLDDFGTGYSSLSYLRSFPLDTLKIDRSFVSHMDTFPDKRQIAEIVVMLARALKLRVVAEGAETQAEIDELAKMNCDYVQGYFYFKPLEAVAAEAVLRKQFGVSAPQ